jgi:hypothetical protein
VDVSRTEAIEFLKDYISGVDHRLECAESVPCRSFYKKMSDAIHALLWAAQENQTLEIIIAGHEARERSGT